MALVDTYQLNVCHIANGKEISNVFYYFEQKTGTAGPITTGLGLCRAFFDDVWHPAWKPAINHNCRLTGIWCGRIWPTLVLPGVTPYSDEEGNQLGDSIPNNACALLTASTFTVSKNYKRRMYISGISESATVQNEINVVQELLLGTLLDTIVTTVLNPTTDPTAEFVAAAFSKKRAAAGDPVPVRQLTGGHVRRQIRSQRGRNIMNWRKGL